MSRQGFFSFFFSFLAYYSTPKLSLSTLIVGAHLPVLDGHVASRFISGFL